MSDVHHHGDEHGRGRDRPGGDPGDDAGRPARGARGPRRLVVVRHGESLGNLADARAHEQHRGRIELDARDADVELSDRGRRQAEALREHLAGLAAPERPDAVLSSPYRRALDTARLALDGGLRPRLDERLRERDLGAFDGLTGQGIGELYPEEAQRRRLQGKFYYRPPGGESWCDVVLRVRSLLRDLRDEHDGEVVWLFTHRAVIMSLRVALEGLDERTVLDVDRDQPLANCALTSYADHGRGLELERYADSSVVDDLAPVTHEPGSAGLEGVDDPARGAAS